MLFDIHPLPVENRHRQQMVCPSLQPVSSLTMVNHVQVRVVAAAAGMPPGSPSLADREQSHGQPRSGLEAPASEDEVCRCDEACALKWCTLRPWQREGQGPSHGRDWLKRGNIPPHEPQTGVSAWTEVHAGCSAIILFVIRRSLQCKC